MQVSHISTLSRNKLGGFQIYFWENHFAVGKACKAWGRKFLKSLQAQKAHLSLTEGVIQAAEFLDTRLLMPRVGEKGEQFFFVLSDKSVAGDFPSLLPYY